MGIGLLGRSGGLEEMVLVSALRAMFLLLRQVLIRLETRNTQKPNTTGVTSLSGLAEIASAQYLAVSLANHSRSSWLLLLPPNQSPNRLGMARLHCDAINLTVALKRGPGGAGVYTRRLRPRPLYMVLPGGLFLNFLNFYAGLNVNAATIVAVGVMGQGFFIVRELWPKIKKIRDTAAAAVIRGVIQDLKKI